LSFTGRLEAVSICFKTGFAGCGKSAIDQPEAMSYLQEMCFPPGWIKPALALALVSTWVLVGLFGYLNRYTRRYYFGLWTAGWVFYALWITSSILVLDADSPQEWEWLRLIWLGLCVLFMFRGTLRFAGSSRGQWWMIWLLLGLVLWSVGARNYLDQKLWLELPLFWVLALASLVAGGYFFQKRLHQQYLGASVLGLGFSLWGIQIAVHPFLENTVKFRPSSFVLASIIQLVIAIGMIILMLEEMRGQASSLREQVRADARLTRHLQRRIELTEFKYDHLFENANDAIFLVDPQDLHVLEANRSAQILSGHSHDDLLHHRLSALCPFLSGKENDIASNPESIQRLFAVQGSIPLRRKDGNQVLTEGSASAATHAKGTILYVFLREITERKRVEQQLRQVEKMSSLGQLISGVAHELNNPLAVINGFAQLLGMRPGIDEKTRKDLSKIQRESDRASKIVHNFLSFARKRPVEKANVNLNRLLEPTLELLDYDMRVSDVRLTKDFQPNLPPVFADANQLEQVFLNLVNNAIQAMQGMPREKALRIRTESSGPCVRVTITDSGKGIPPAILNKIFDPFFTTKEVGMGTGLGLSISYSIVKEHSGNITASNNESGGASFVVELPISHVKDVVKKPADKVAEEPVRVNRSRTPRRKPFQVLVVDDEPAILDVFSELLVDHACHVKTANNGLQALDHVQQQHFDLILCDLKMPSMDGQRFFEEIRKSKPEMVGNIIFITGDTNSPKTVDFLRNTNHRWLAKPFNFGEVEAVLNEHFQGIQELEEASSVPEAADSKKVETASSK
jgi:PAS domain S-box-containing protein